MGAEEESPLQPAAHRLLGEQEAGAAAALNAAAAAALPG